MNLVGRALFFRTGLRQHVRDEIERRAQRDRKATAKLEHELHQLRESSAAARESLGRLSQRLDDLAKKHSAATELLAQQRERIGQLKDEVQALEKARLDERLTALEHARRGDHAERVDALTSELEALFPVSSLEAHVRQVVGRSALIQDPYPHVVLDDVLPDSLHLLLYEARPSAEFWRSGQEGRQNWTIGDDLGPLRTEAVWGFMNDVVAPRILMPVLTALFEDYLSTQNGRSGVSAAGDDSNGDSYQRSGGRLMVRRPGYHFEPHLDPRRALLTALLYFGSPGASHDHGTKLFRSNGTIPATHRGVYYPLREGATCELAKIVPSRPNSMLVFASRIGLHGADIPADAQPPTLERYAYQFYIGKAPS